MTASTEAVYTIGHSTHALDAFLALLRRHRITALADVRSSPYSRYNPQFNRETLHDSLRQARIDYVFLGRELGGRGEDQSCYRDGRVQYELLAKTALFKSGIERLGQRIGASRHALMCAEKDPLSCHRTILVARALAEGGVAVRHILADGALETQDEAIARLRRALKLPDGDLFRSQSEIVAEAYRLQGQSIAFEEGEDAPPAHPGEGPGSAA